MNRTLAACVALVCPLAMAVPIAGQGTWESTLKPRDLNADGAADAYYDTALNITWLANANVIGPTTWDPAMGWAAGLNVHGVMGWRLPWESPVNGHTWQLDSRNNGTKDYGRARTGVGWGTASELGHMFYVTLGNLGHCIPSPTESESAAWKVQPGFGLSNTGPFLNVMAHIHSSGRDAEDPVYDNAWAVYMAWGDRGVASRQNIMNFASAVRDGDVRPVPEPSS